MLVWQAQTIEAAIVETNKLVNSEIWPTAFLQISEALKIFDRHLSELNC